MTGKAQEEQPTRLGDHWARNAVRAGPKHTYCRIIAVRLGNLHGGRVKTRGTLRKLPTKSRKRVMQYATYQALSNLVYEAGAVPADEPSRVANDLLDQAADPAGTPPGAHPLLRLYQRTLGTIPTCRSRRRPRERVRRCSVEHQSQPGRWPGTGTSGDSQMPPNDRRKPPRPKLGLIVRDGQCRTCIYRPGSPLDLEKLEAEVANPYDRNTFDTYRACHEFRGRTVVCAGFWKHHGARCQIGQIAHRLRRVYTVDINGGVTLRARNEHPPGTAGPPTTPDARPLDTPA